jgi:hypothetical protein
MDNNQFLQFLSDKTTFYAEYPIVAKQLCGNSVSVTLLNQKTGNHCFGIFENGAFHFSEHNWLDRQYWYEYDVDVFYILFD